MKDWNVDWLQEERRSVMQELQEKIEEVKSLEAEIEKYKDCDPEVMKHKQKETKIAQEAANRWTGELSVMDQFCYMFPCFQYVLFAETILHVMTLGPII